MQAFKVPTARSERGHATRTFLHAERQRLRILHQSSDDAAAATRVARAWAEVAQQAVVALFERAVADAPQAAPMALVALGSLGRMELAPYSDLDLTLVCDSPYADATRAVADAMFYPLWDGRLEVGHSVRSCDDFARLVLEDETVRTAAVDMRPLAGNAALLQNLSTQLQRALGSSATRRYATASALAWTQGNSSPTVYRLEPDIKTGPGGLREIHRVWWLARLLWKVDSWHDLLSLGLVDRHGLDVLAAGREALLNIRLAMHFVAGRRQDHLRFDVQDEVAAYLRLAAGPGQRTTAQNLLEIFYRNAKAVRTVTLRVLERAAEALAPPVRPPHVTDVEGFDLFQGKLTLHAAHQLETTPVDILRIFRVAQKLGLRLYVHARARISAAAPRVIDDALRTDVTAAQLFMNMLTDARDAGETLLLLHELGVLERFVPEFAHVTALAQRDLYHLHTVDAHLVTCAQRAILVCGERDPEAPPDIVEIARGMQRTHAVVLGALLHDIGKGHGHGHSERGEILARQACARWSLSEQDVNDIAFLVLEHLTLFKISQRRDMEDEQLIMRLAETVQTQERLEMLYVVSYCDAITTGPEAWTQWKAQLLRELYGRARDALRNALGDEVQGSEGGSRLAEAVASAPAKQAALQALAARLLPRHLASHPASLLLQHLTAVESAAATGAACLIDLGSRVGSWEIVLVGPDRPGLLADLTGVLAASGVGVDAAYISGTIDGLAIDTFVVQDGPAFAHADRCDKLRHELCDAALGRTDYTGRIHERVRAQAQLPSGLPVPETRIVYDFDAPSKATVVDVFAPDRIGLLRDIAEAIFQAGISIMLARITTQGEKAVDAFYLVNARTHAPLSEAERATFEKALKRAVSGRE